MEKHSEYVNIGDRRIRNIKVAENHEPFIDLTQDNRIIVDTSKKQIYNGNRYYSYVRKGIHRKLMEAKNYLPEHISFFIKEGYRSPKLQKSLFQYYYPIFQTKLKGLPEELLYEEVCKYVAPVELAPHPTGGAVDLTLIDDDGNALEMGTEFNAEPAATNYATYFDAANISAEAKNNRAVLQNALERVGLVNYFT